ncbi:ABC transporter substrate-binding protein [Cohnella thailandensis]|nr:ABC transporter substrate-binding protein [Cohnella thailandensis]MBP1975285.1 iron complex transport system substrate-binding protein [Cohnella thailandensis]
MVKKMKGMTFLIALLCGIMLVSACSNSNSNSSASGSPSASQSASESEPASPSAQPAASASEEAGKFPRAIQAANGEITIQEEPKKIAVVHWGYGDSILLFNLESLALALPFSEETSVLKTDSYKPYVDKVKELKTVGENTQVNLEALVAYDPDLIIGGNSVNAEIAGELEKIAPTVLIDEATTNIWGDWPAVVTKFGEILGQEEVASDYISEFRGKVEEAKAKLADLGGNVAFLQVREKEAWLQGTNYLQPYYEGGLNLTPPDSADIKEGAQLSLEGLAELNPDYLFLGYFNYGDKSVPALTDEWEKSEVWKKLKAVQDGRVYGINGELALGYGPIGNSYGVQAIVDSLGQ